MSNVRVNLKCQHLYLVLFQPLLQKLLPTLLEDGTSELQRLEMIQFAFFEEDTKILQNRREPTRRCRGLLEGFDDLNCAKNTLITQE